MNTIFVNAAVDDDERRSQLFQGHLFVYAANSATEELCQVARDLCEETFAPHHPQEAQHHMEVESYVETLKTLKPAFIHDPRSKAAIRNILEAAGCDIEKTYFDVPRLRTSTAGGYLTSGLAYVFKPHRDTWYSTPMCQINWWLPVYPAESDNVMAFHPRYWDSGVKNSSNKFNYQDWNRTGRADASKQVGKDARRQSEALEPVELDPQIRVLTEPNGLLMFSAAQLHSSVPNTTDRTRISIDFRTVHLDDLTAQRGAPNVDGASTGTTIHDYLQANDLSHIPQEIRVQYGEQQFADEELSPQFRSGGAS